MTQWYRHLAAGVALLSSPGLSHAADCGVVNGSFETGTLSGWILLDLNEPLFPAGIDSGSGIDLLDFGWGAAPTDGDHAFFHGFEGDGASTGLPIVLAQLLRVPGPELSFEFRAGWDLATFQPPGASDRHFDVALRDPGNGAELARFPLLTVPAGTRLRDTTVLPGSVDVSAFVGQDVLLSFEWFVPDDFSGPAQFILDNVCFNLCRPDINGDGFLDIADISAFVDAFLARDAVADLNGDSVLDLGDINAFVQAFLAGC